MFRTNSLHWPIVHISGSILLYIPHVIGIMPSRRPPGIPRMVWYHHSQCWMQICKRSSFPWANTRTLNRTNVKKTECSSCVGDRETNVGMATCYVCRRRIRWEQAYWAKKCLVGSYGCILGRDWRLHLLDLTGKARQDINVVVFSESPVSVLLASIY